MSNRRRPRPRSGPRPTEIAEAIVTAGMVQQWLLHPELVPPEWRDFWESKTTPEDLERRRSTFSDGRPVPDEAPERLEAPREFDEDDLVPVRPATILDSIAQTSDQRAAVERSIAAQVGMARAAGHIWQEIGTALGVSKQAAAQRYGP